MKAAECEEAFDGILEGFLRLGFESASLTVYSLASVQKH